DHYGIYGQASSGGICSDCNWPRTDAHSLDWNSGNESFGEPSAQHWTCDFCGWMGDSAIVAVLAGADCRWSAGGRCLSRSIWGVKIAVSDVRIRTAESGDLARITEIYNHYVLNTP